MHPRALNAGCPVCCGVKYPGDTLDECTQRSYVDWGPSSMSRVRNGDALVGGVEILGGGPDPSLSRSGEGFAGERVHVCTFENSSESDLGLG